MTDTNHGTVSYTMLSTSEEKTLAAFEEVVVRFVTKVLGGTERPIWTGGAASEGRRIRLVVPGLMPPVILELLPNEIQNLTTTTLTQLLNEQISRQRK